MMLMTINTGLTSPLDRGIPRTCTSEIAALATSGDNQETSPLYVTDLAIDPVTKKVDFSQISNIGPPLEETLELRKRMKELLDLIVSFFEDEHKEVEDKKIKEEEVLFTILS